MQDVKTCNVVAAFIIFAEEVEDKKFLKVRDKINMATTSIIAEEEEAEVNLPMVVKVQKMSIATIATSLDTMLVIVGVNQ